MKIIYVGGYSDKENSHFTRIAPMVKEFMNNGKNIVFVNFAKEAGYFNERLIQIYGFLPQTIDDNTPNDIKWETYDLIYIPGGATKKLKQALEDYGFDIKKLKEDVTVIGDSAGANILAKYYIGTKMDTSEYSIENGFNPESNILVLPHVDNIDKTPQDKIEYASKKAKELNAELLLLDENEIVIYESF